MNRKHRAGRAAVRGTGLDRFRTGTAVWFLCILILAAALPAAAQVDQALSDASAWLAAHQNLDGSFGTTPELAPRDSALSVLALLGGDPNSPALANGLIYVQNVPEESTYFHSLRVQALARAGRSFTPLLDSLFSFRNSQGFGAFSAHETNLFDTALAVQALATDEANRVLDILPLVDYLRLSQNSDGGWGFLDDDPSLTYYTAEVLLAFASLKELSVAPQVLNAATSYLLARQLPNGSFGSVLETALVYRALLARGYDVSTLPTSPVSYLLAQQLPNGSWENDHFTTAQAVLALRQQLPNLTVTALTANPANAPLGTPITLTATVRNTGPVAAPATTLVVRARTVDGEERATAPVAALASGAQTNVQVTIQTAGDSGNLKLFAIADGRSEVAELDETDNSRSVEIGLRTGPDLAIFAPSLAVSPSQPKPNTAFNLQINAQNLGETAIPSFRYRVSRLVAGVPTQPVENTAGPIAAGGALLIQVPLNLPEGEHIYEVVLDPLDTVDEESEGNNEAEIAFFVTDPARPDFTIAAADLTITPAQPAPGQTATVGVKVKNVGTKAGTALLEIFNGDPAAGGTLIGSQSVTLNAGATSALINKTFTVGPSSFFVTAIVDRANAVAELDEANNRLRRVFRDLPDPAVGFDGFSYSPAEPLENDPVQVSLTVRNAGTLEATNVQVEVFDGDPAAGGVSVFSTRVPSIPAGGNRPVSFSWPAAAGLRRLVTVIDRGGEIVEFSEDNNRTEREIAVPRSTGPDLSVASVDTSGLTQAPATLQAQGAVQVQIANSGDGLAAGTPFVVRLFEDRDGDGRFSAGDQDLGSAPVAGGLAGGATASVAITVDAGLEFHRPLVFAEADATDVIPERREDNNRKALFGSCEVLPPASIEPVEEWYVPGVEIQNAPVVVQLSDDNGDGAIDSRDNPDVVFHASDAQGRLVLAVSGLDGSRLWAFRSTAANPLQSAKAHVSAADLDGDGVVEIIAVQTNNRLVALDRTGAVRWVSDPIETTGGDWRGGSAVADLTGDGVPEIVVGRAVLSNTGRRIAIGTANAGRNHNYYGPMGVGYIYDQQHSIVADVDLDGRAEIVAGDAVYRLVDGVLTVVWDHREHDNMLYDGFSAVANLDADPYPEIVYVSAGFVMILNHDGSTRTSYRRLVTLLPPITEDSDITFWGGPPTVADLTGDGVPEILVAADTELIAYNANLGAIWRRPTFDVFAMTTATAFDLDGDGRREVIYNDENYLYILNGANGAPLYQRKNTSLTGTEYPVVADLDNDGSAEILVPSSRHRNGDTSTQGLHVLGNPSWRGTRPIWNQHSYHVTNVGLDGTVPASETPAWQVGNTWRVNQELPRRARRLPNLTLGLPRVAEATASGIPVTVRVGNGGRGTLGAGVRVRLYDSDPAGGSATAGGEGVTTMALAPGGWADLTVLWQAPGEAPRTAFAQVDPDAAIEECDEADNGLDLVLTETLLSDLFIPAGGVTAPASAAAGQVVTVSVQVKNVGAAASTAAVVRLYDGEPAQGIVVGEAPLATLAPGATATVPVRWSTLGASGTHGIHAVADGAGAVPEVDETNNEGLVVIQLTAATLPDLSAEALQVSATEVAPGEPVRATVTVLNRGTSLANGFKVALRVNGAQDGAAVTSAGDLDAGASRDVELTLQTLGRSGVLTLEARLDPLGEVAEQNETNNASPQKEVRVLAADTSLALHTDRTSYGPGETVAFQATATNSAAGARTLDLRLAVIDSAGAEIAVVASQAVTLAPGANPFSFSWGTGASLPGAYSGVVELREGGVLRARATAPFSIARQVDLRARLIADRDLYKPGQTAILTGTVTNESLNQILEGLTARIAVTGPSGTEVFATQQTLLQVLPGVSLSVNAVWPLGTAAPGSYIASLSVRDTGGKLLAFGSTRLEVEDSAQSGAGLEGRLTAAPPVVAAGAPLVLDFALTNRGNADLAALPLRFDVVRLSDGVVVGSLARTLAVARNQTVAGSLGLPTAGLADGDYLVVLVAIPPAGEIRLDSEPFTAVRGVSIGDATVTEGDGGTSQASFAVTLSSASDQPISVAYATSDSTATAGTDYESVSGTLSFAPGEVEKVVSVGVFGDVSPEIDEVFLVELTAPVNASLGDAQGLGTIADEEGCPGPNLLVNPGAEEATASGALTGWTAEADSEWAPRFGNPAPLAGLASFGALGGTAELRQDVDVSAYAARIDAGLQRFAFGGFVQSADEPAPDAARIVIEYRDAANAVLASFDSGELASPGGWRSVVDERLASAGTRWIRVRLLATRNSGETTDAGFDRLALVSAGAPVLRVEDVDVTEGDAGTSPARFRVTLSCPNPAAASIGYVTRADSATEGSDYEAASGTLPLAAGATEGFIEVPVRGDTTDEADETFFLDLTVPESLVALDPTAAGLVLDDDGPVSISIDDVVVTEGDAGTTEALFTLSLSAASGREVRVSIATANGTATAGSDYQATSGTVVFPPGTTTQTASVAVLGDRLDELLEGFTVHLSAPVHATLADADGEARITDDDEVLISVADVQVVEGDSGTVPAVFTVTLSVPSVRQVSVSYTTVNVTATAPADYTAVAGVLTFAPGTTSQTVTVAVKGELTKEPEETFLVRLSSPVDALLAKPEGVGTILDNDGSLISIGNVTVRESDSGPVTATLNVTLSKSNTQTITVGFATIDGTAVSGSDYAPASGTVTFSPGVTSRPVTVTVVSDDDDEPLEKLSVRLSNAVNASILDDTGEITIIDDDGWSLNGSASDTSTTVPAGCILLTPAVNLIAGSAWRNEPRDLTRSFDDTFRVYLGSVDGSGADGIAFAVQNLGLTALGSNGPGLGYSGVLPSLGVDIDTHPNTGEIAADHMAVEENGATTHNGHPPVQASAAGVNIEDNKEHLLRVVWNAPTWELTAYFDGAQRLIYRKDVVSQIFGGSSQVYYGITGGTGLFNNLQYFCETEGCYGPGGSPKVSIGDVTLLEGDGGSVQALFPVTLSCPSNQPITVGFATVAGTAEAGTDFVVASGTVTFAPGETSKTVAVDLIPDTRGEDDETFFVDLSNPIGAALRYARGTAMILTDEVTVSIGDAAVSEGNSGTHSVSVPVMLGRSFGQAISIPYATADGTAGATDYTPASGTVVFQPGETSKTVTVVVKGDTAPEGNEAFFVRLAGADAADLADGEAVVTLLDDDDCPSANLLRNGSADEPLVNGELPGWTEVVGNAWTQRTANPPPFEGGAYFYAGTVAAAELRQDVDVFGFAERIDDGEQRFAFEGFVRSFDQDPPDHSRIVVEYRDAANAAILSSFDSGDFFSVASWFRISDLRTPPAGTRWIRIRLIATRFNGSENNGFFDALSLRALGVPALTIGGVTVTEGNAGTTPAVFPVTLSCVRAHPVSVDYFTVDGTASSGSDYQPVSGTLVFQPGEVAKTVTVQVVGDTENESNETFVLQLASPVDAVLAQAQATATIVQDESLASIGGAEVLEGDSGQIVANFTVTLSRASDQEIRIDYTTEDGTAAAGSDYTAAAGTLVFAPGQTSKTIAVQITGDTVVEPDETFFVQLGNPVRVSLATDRATGTIVQDDLSISIGDAAVIEGNTGQIAAVFEVTLSTPSSKTVTVQYLTVDGFATAPADYTAVGTTTLTFSPGQTAKTIAVQVKGDTLVEPSETFFVRLLNPVNAQILDDEGQGTIADDDDCPSPNLLRNPSGDDALVGNEIPGWTEVGTGTLWTRRTASPSPVQGSAYFYAGAVAEGELRQDVDVSTYAPYIDTGTQRFFFESYVQSAGETPADTAQILVEYRNAANEDPPLAVFDSGALANVGSWRQVVDLQPAPAGTRWVRVRLVSRRNATANSEANAYFDGLSLRSLGKPALIIDDGARGWEGDFGPEDLAFTVRLTCPWTQTVRVDYATVPGTAQAGADYQPVQGTLSFAPGTTVQTVVVPILADLFDETEETLSLTLSNEAVAALIDRQETGTIVDDDPPPAWLVRDVEVTEGNAGTVEAAFTVELSHPSFNVLTVDYRTVNGDALAGSDYVTRTGQLSFQPGEQTKTVAVTVTGDTADEVDERFYLELLNPINGVLADPVGAAVILDDDDNRTCAGPNLVRNGGAEEPLAGSEIPRWTEIAGTAWTRRTASPAPFEGFAYFSAPGSSELAQEAVLTGYAGSQSFAYEAFLRTSSNSHGSRVALDFLDAGGTVLATVSSPEVTTSGSWVKVSGTQLAPAGAARLRLRLLCRSTSTSQVCFFDNVSVRSTGTRVLWADDLSVSESTGQAAFRVRLSCPDSGAVTAGFTTADGSAVAGLDYQATSGSVTFAPGETLRIVDVPLVDDNASEPEEELFLDLGPVTGAPLARARTIGTIVDDDGPAVDLILCFDGSGSIDASEFALQLGGMAAALEDPGVMPHNGSVRLSIFQFASDARQEMPPTLVTAANVADLATRVRSIIQINSSTNIPACMVLARDTLARVVPPALKRVLDVSTDGVSTGDVPGEADRTTAAGIDVINAIAVGDGVDLAALNAMVRPQPAGGPEGFVVVAQTFAQYEAAIAQKIQREVSPDLAVTKTDGRDTAVPGQPVNYVITVTNVGAAPVIGLQVTDPLPGIVNPAFTPSAGTYDAVTGLWSGLQLDSGQAVTLTIAGTVNPAATGTLTNTVTVLPPEGTNDLDPANNTASDSTQLAPAADLAIAKSHMGELFVGDQATYTLTVSNAGPSAAAGPIAVTDVLPAGLSFVAAAGEGWTCATSGSSVNCQHTGPLAPGASMPALALQVAVGTQAVPSVTNSATVAGPTADPNAANNTASDTAPVLIPRPELHAEKTAALAEDRDGDGVPSPGDVLAYEIVIRNAVGAPATAVILRDVVPAHTKIVAGSVTSSRGTVTTEDPVEVAIGTLAASESATVRFRVAIDPAVPLDTTEVSNQGLVLSSELPALPTDDPALGGASDPTVTPITLTPKLVAEKTAELVLDGDGDGVPSPGDTLRYSIRLLSVGNTPVVGIVLHDEVPANTRLVSGSVETSRGTVEPPVTVEVGELAVGEIATVRFQVRIDNPIAAGVTQVANQGTVESGNLPGTLLTDDPSVGGDADPTVTVVSAAPVLAAEKTAALFADEDGNGYVSPGDVLLYRVRLFNRGNTAATRVVLADPVPAHTTVVAGSVQASQGTVVKEVPVEVDLGEVAAGSTVDVTFQVRIDPAFPVEEPAVSNQGQVTSQETAPVATDDPGTPEAADPTRTEVFIPVALSIADVTVSEGVGSAVFLITLDRASNHPVSVTFSLSDGSARAGEDYVDDTGSLSIPAGSTSASLPVEIVSDAIDEADESFAVHLASPSIGRLADGEAVGTIQDDDEPPLLAVDDVSVEEGDSGTVDAVFTVSLSAPTSREVRVHFATADDSAHAPEDYLAASGDLVLPAGTTSATVRVQVVGDRLDEADERFVLRLSQPVNALLGDGEGQGTILDDEEAELSIGDVEVREGDSGTVEAVFPVHLSSAAVHTVTVGFSTSGVTATSGTDFVAVSGQVSFAAGETDRSVTVQVKGDLVLEADETFQVTLADAVGAAIADGVGVGTILDDEVCLGANLVLNPGAEERPAGGEIPAWKEIEGTQWLPKSAPPLPYEGLSSFFSNLTQYGELRQDVDVSAFAARIEAGLQRFAFSARLRSFDELPPDVGRVVVEYRDASNQAALAVFDSGEVASVSEWSELTDTRTAPEGTRWIRIRLLTTRLTPGTNDSLFDAISLRPLGTAAVSVDDVIVYEGSSGLRDAVFTVRLSCPYSEALAVGYATANGTALAPGDYLTRSGSLSFAPGATVAQVPVPVVGDRVDEPNETFFLNLTLAPGVATVLADPQGKGTIWNDDFCQRSPGYWKTHPSVWAVEELQIGGIWYYKSQLLSFLSYSGSDASTILTHHLVATKLNLERGSDPTWGATPSVLPTVGQADLFLAAHPPGSNPTGTDRDLALQLKDVLDAYNNAGCRP